MAILFHEPVGRLQRINLEMMILHMLISKSAQTDLKASEMALAISPDSVANSSCRADRRAVDGPSPWEGEASNLAPFSTTLDFNVHGAFFLPKLLLLFFF